MLSFEEREKTNRFKTVKELITCAVISSFFKTAPVCYSLKTKTNVDTDKV